VKRAGKEKKAIPGFVCRTKQIFERSQTIELRAFSCLYEAVFSILI
jgi:hypothetical protein